MSGKLVLLIGPSGSGKGTLLVYVRDHFPDLAFPTSWTTRPPREGELDSKGASGKRYRFVSPEEFMQAKDRGAFLEWDHHVGNYYGTPAQEVLGALEAGRTVFQELEIRGAKQLLKKLPREQIKIIFVTAGSWDNLVHRILSRQPMSKEELEKRRLRYEDEMLFVDNADFVLVNEENKLPETEKKLGEIMTKVLNE